MNDETKIPLGIAYLDTTITVIFNVIAYLMAYYFMSANNTDMQYTINITTVFSIFALILIVLFT